MKKIISILISSIAFSAATAGQISANSHSREFCDLAKDLGYPSRGYNESTGSCSSSMTDVTSTPGSNRLKNNLAYYSTGDDINPKKLDSISIVLNVNNTAEKAKAYSELKRVAKEIATKLIGKIPNGFNESIINGKYQSWNQEDWVVVVKTKVWPTGQGQDTRIEFQPRNK